MFLVGSGGRRGGATDWWSIYIWGNLETSEVILDLTEAVDLRYSMSFFRCFPLSISNYGHTIPKIQSRPLANGILPPGHYHSGTSVTFNQGARPFGVCLPVNGL